MHMVRVATLVVALACLLVRPGCATQVSLLHERHDDPEPLSLTRIYLRRMRKAGSTTVFGVLMSALKRYRHATNTSGIIFDRVEYESTNMQCIFGPTALLTRGNGVFLVTHLREPISRINSEYWFKGPGSLTGLANESLWNSWIEVSRPFAHGGNARLSASGAKFNEGIYFDNYFTRMFTGNCADVCEMKKGGKIHKNDGTDGTPGGAVGGCAAHTRKNPYRIYKPDDLARAKDVVGTFDIVLIMEWFNQPDLNLYLREKLKAVFRIESSKFYAIFDDLTLGWGRKTSTQPATKESAAYLKIPPPAIRSKLEVENALDIDLYKWAVARVLKELEPFAAQRIEQEALAARSSGTEDRPEQRHAHHLSIPRLLPRRGRHRRRV